MAQKTGIPKGTRDFLPLETVKRNYLFDNIRNVFKKYGFLPIETPAMETLDTLMGKYGEEGDKLLFKILNSGDYLAKVDGKLLEERQSTRLTSQLSEKGLRYDLTVPFARYVVQHQNDLHFPFKRYQIQPVWRADRPQKGRYREFYQCDVDIVGSESLLNEFELLQITDSVFQELGVAITIKLNNRKILAGIASYIGAENALTDITVAMDKIEKIGLEKVEAELYAKGLNEESVALLRPILTMTGNNQEKLNTLKSIFTEHRCELGLKGIEELMEVLSFCETCPIDSTIELDLTLARGLNYYTGIIIEVKALDYEIGSICGGGRYDNLTEVFGVKGLSGVGISFGADRIYDVMQGLALFPEHLGEHTQLLFINFGETEMRYCLPLLSELRQAGISAELYAESAKMKKQMTYANKKNIPFVVMAGEEEVKSETVTLKNMKTGEQKTVPKEQLTEILTNQTF